MVKLAIFTVVASSFACGQVTGVVTSAQTGQPLAKVLVMGGGLNWTETDQQGKFILPPERFRGANAPPELPVSFRAEGYRPLTKIAASEFAVLNAALEDGAATEWKVSTCRNPAVNGKTIGDEMEFTLPDNLSQTPYSDVDYSGGIVTLEAGGEMFSLRTMSGPLCCGGHPLAESYLDSTSVTERAWTVKFGNRTFDGLDSRGVSRDGTRWRWIGPRAGELAEYAGASEQAAKVFDSILDTLCIRTALYGK